MAIRFALNHMTAPRLALGDFFALTRALGLTEVEIRNDLPGVAIADGTPAADVKAAAEAAGVTILTINALYPFNDWTAETAAKAVALADYARDCGAQALVLVPRCDGTAIGQDALVTALAALKPILSERGLIGLVEPLGFTYSSLRSKAKAAAAIDAAGGAEVFRLLHDTFHHYLAGEPKLFPVRTGLVHISGVTDTSLALEDIRDPHRVLVDKADILDNVGQLKALVRGGYKGPASFEPFAPEIHALADPAAAVKASMDHVSAGL